MQLDTKALLQLAYRTAARIVRNPVLAEEAGERAVHRLVLATLSGHAPAQPEAWVRTVARRSACAILRHGWSRMQPIPEEDCIADDHPGRRCRRRTTEEMRSLLERALTARQTQAFDAALSCATTKDAARTCGMQPRDFRRYLAAIARRAHRELARCEGSVAAGPGGARPRSEPVATGFTGPVPQARPQRAALPPLPQLAPNATSPAGGPAAILAACAPSSPPVSASRP